MSRYTIVAIAGDNGMTFTIGLFGSREGAQRHVDAWTERDNPEHDGELMSYSVTRIETIAGWDATA